MAKYKSLQDNRLREHNIMALYDAPSLQKVLEILRLGYLNKEMPKFGDKLIKRAQERTEKLNEAYDRSMYDFAQALYRYAFTHVTGNRHIDGSVLGISGSIEGKNNIEHTVLTFDLGPNPWEIYEKQNLPKGRTRDTDLTENKSKGWIKERIYELHGFDKLRVERSRIFFSFFGELGRERNIFFTEDGLNLDELVPYLMWTGGYIGYTPVAGKYPTREEFAKKSPQSVSYRLKNSLSPRLAQLIISERGLFQDLKETLADWAAVRVVLDTEDSVYQFMVPFLKAYHENRTVRIGNNYVDIIYTEDRFGEHKKSSGFQDFKMAIHPFTTEKGTLKKGLVVEMQVTDKMSFYNHEIDETHKAHHLKREGERELLMPIAKDRKRAQHIKNTMSNFQKEIANDAIEVLNKIFPDYFMGIDIDEFR